MTTHTAPSHTGPTDWKDVLAKRTARPRANVLRLNPSVEKTAALVDAPVGQTSIDEGRRCATFVISTPTPDRSEDVVSPRGVQLENYAKNPVVYYDHGFSGIHVPIGKCEDESGQLAVVVTDEGIEGTCFFAESVEGQQIFELVKQSVLRAASINLTPITYTIRKDDGTLGRPGMEIAEWELLEWSVVGLPDNPQAIRKILAGGKLAGSPICDPIRKSLLTAWPKPEAKLLGKGFSPMPAPAPVPALDSDPLDEEDEGVVLDLLQEFNQLVHELRQSVPRRPASRRGW